MLPWLRSAFVPLVGLALGACAPEPPPVPSAPAPVRRLSVDQASELLESVRGPASAPVRAALEEAAPAAPVESVICGARLIDAQFRPIAGGVLAWCLRGEWGLPEERLRASADRNGTVWLTLPRAEFEAAQGALQAFAPGFARVLVSPPAGRARDGAPLNLGELTLPPGGSVRGRVLDEAGRALPRVRVWLGQRTAAGPEAERALQRLYPGLEPVGIGQVAESDAGGEFQLGHAPVGAWRLLALSAPEDARRVPAVVEVEVRPGGSTAGVELVLAAPLATEIVRGRVLAPDRTPLAHASIELLGADEPPLGRWVGGSSRADGTFALLVPDGSTWRLEARAPEQRWAAVQSAPVAGGDEVELVFVER